MLIGTVSLCLFPSRSSMERPGGASLGKPEEEPERDLGLQGAPRVVEMSENETPSFPDHGRSRWTQPLPVVLPPLIGLSG